MTPIIFVSFLFSLAWVEFRYSMLRSHYHVKPLPDHKTDGSVGKDIKDASVNDNQRQTARCHRRMPEWLHSFIYRRQPCQNVPVGDDSQHAGAATVSSTRSADNGTYYHSMQRKLLKMESEEAFRIRTTVLCIVIVAALGSVWVSIVAMRWVASYFLGFFMMMGPMKRETRGL